MTIPARTKIVLSQLIGHYGGQFQVGEDQYLIEETSLDTGATRSRKMRLGPHRHR